MSFLAPAALWFLLLLGPLLWLWRFTESRRTIVIPSLAPFLRLREQRPKSHWVRSNLLLLLQIFLIMALVGALAQPRLHGMFARPHQTVVMILDNSASMRAGTGWSSAYLRAKTEVLHVAGSLSANDRLIVVSTSPPQLVTPQSTADHAAAIAAINRLDVTDAPGDLAGAIQLAQSLVGARGAHRFLVATDEPKPSGALPPMVEWHQVGKALPNVALTQFELSHVPAAHVPLTATVDVANFADAAQDVEIALLSGTATVLKQTVHVAPSERRAVSLGPFTLTDDESVTATIRAPQDALTADNSSTIARRGAEQVGLILQGLPAPLQQTFERLTRSAPTLTLTSSEFSRDVPPIHVVHETPATEPQTPMLYLWPSDARRKSSPIRIVDWDAAHPVTRYLDNIDRLPLTAVRDVEWPAWAHTIVWGSDGMRSVPLVGVGQRAGFREVVTTIGVDSVNFEDPRAVELLILLLNSCHWLAPSNQTMRLATGASLTIPYLPPGEITVVLPTGETRRLSHVGGAWEFADTWWAGQYRVSSGAQRWSFFAALVDERESNLQSMHSSIPDGLWSAVSAQPSPSRVPRPVDRWLWWLGAFLVVGEWLLYQRRIAARSAT